MAEENPTERSSWAKAMVARPLKRSGMPVLLALACFGCAAKVNHAYAGPELPPQEVAMLAGSKHGLYLLFYNRVIFVVPESVDEYSAEPQTSEWALLPGPHTVHTAYYMNRLFMLGAAFFSYKHPPRRQTLTFNAQPGHRYRVDGHVVEPLPAVNEYCAWIEDDGTGETVAGVKDCTHA